jgi:hypothetical protein
MTAKRIPLFAADASVRGTVTQIDRPNVYGLEEHSETITRMYSGEITAVELKAKAKRFWESETVVAELIDRLRRSMAMDYLVPNSTSGYASITFNPMQETYGRRFSEPSRRSSTRALRPAQLAERPGWMKSKRRLPTRKRSTSLIYSCARRPRTICRMRSSPGTMLWFTSASARMQNASPSKCATG